MQGFCMDCVAKEKAFVCPLGMTQASGISMHAGTL
jgi:hypothetical protein